MANKNRSRVEVPQPKLSENEKIRFSFEFYDSNKYCLSEWKQNQIKSALIRLQQICTVSFNDLRRGANIYHFHEVDWKTTNEKSGFSSPAVNNLQPFQFALLGINNQRARVYGAYAKSVFYIVWFDLNHRITPSVLKNT